MTTIKVKFRESFVEGGKGTIYYQVIHGRVSRQMNTGYSLSVEEWECHLSGHTCQLSDEKKRHYLQEIESRLKADLERFNQIISTFNHNRISYTVDDLIAEFLDSYSGNYLFPFMEKLVLELRELGKIRTSEAYASSLNSFKRFRKEKDLLLNDIHSELMIAYESYLKSQNISPNSSSFYMRNLRAAYNRAVEKGMVTQCYPFKHVYTGVEKTIKRAISLNDMKRIKELDLTASPSLDFARDMFLFSFYTRGMSFVDMAYLRKKDLNGGILSYRRRKTGQLLHIQWEKCMQEIVDKYNTSHSIYLLPFIKPSSITDERKQYIYAEHNVNRSLKKIGTQLGLPVVLTTYVSRHAWASIAKSKNIPISVISEGMGHDSESTTRIYLASLDAVEIDKANSIILQSL